MKTLSGLLRAALLLGLSACGASYTESEAPKQLALDNASTHVVLRFPPGSSFLPAGEAARLRALAASGGLRASDRVLVAAGGGPALAEARFQTIARELLPYRIVAGRQPLAGAGGNRAVIESERYLVTLPACPDWSKQPWVGFTNTHASNFGCANAVNLGQMVAYPADLAEGRPLAAADGAPAAAAVNRYLTDKVQLPTAAALGPIAAPTNQAPGAAGGGTGGPTGSTP